jgi:hypothetical protein
MGVHARMRESARACTAAIGSRPTCSPRTRSPPVPSDQISSGRKCRHRPPTGYRRPEESYDSAAPSGSESASSASSQQQFILGTDPAAEWWTTFASRELDAIVGEAIARNQTLASAKASVVEASELVADWPCDCKTLLKRRCPRIHHGASTKGA